jgi:hypothetical protein
MSGKVKREWRYARTDDDGIHVVHAHVWGPTVSVAASGNLDYKEPDMRLIAAAPELLEALQALYERYLLAIGNEGPEAAAARLAIAKAAPHQQSNRSD